MGRMHAGGRFLALTIAALCIGLGVSGCGTGASDSAPASDTGASAGAENTQGGSDEAPAGEGDEAEAPDSAGGDAPTTLTGEPLPDGWPSEYLVPFGEVTLVLPIGAGVSVLVEGVDNGQAMGLIDEMVASGLASPAGVTDVGNGEWVAEVTGAGYEATYHYETGGAGLPNVEIMLLPDH